MTRGIGHPLVNRNGLTPVFSNMSSDCHATTLVIFSGWWLTYPSKKYESQLGLLFPTYGKIKNVPNHQPVYMCFAFLRKFLPGKRHGRCHFFHLLLRMEESTDSALIWSLERGKTCQTTSQPLPTTVDPPTMLQLCQQNKVPYEADRICILGAFWKTFSSLQFINGDHQPK